MPPARATAARDDSRRRRRLVGLVFSRRRRRSAAGRCACEGVGRGSIQGDVRFAEVLRAMGAAGRDGRELDRGARQRRRCAPFDADLNHIPDAAMTAAVAGAVRRRPSTLRNIGSWRVKETDRIAAMATELAQARRRRGGGGGLPAHDAAGASARRRRDRHLRRPPHGDVLLAGGAGRRARCASTIRAASPRPFPSTSRRFAGSRRERGPGRSRSTARRPRARARSRSASRLRSGFTTSTAARCTGWWRSPRYEASRKQLPRRWM